MPEIVLSTLNARYHHASFGLRYLLANLGDLRGRARLVEFEIKQRPIEIAERILAEDPRVVGLGVYLWNAAASAELASLLKRVRPELIVVVGGPEVSHEIDRQRIARIADYVIAGEGDLAFAGLCRKLLAGERPPGRIVRAEPPDLGRLNLPYDEYGEEDIAHRVIYVEASRGCPFSCEFCLSALDGGVRPFGPGPFLRAMEGLMGRGVRRFKFVDRTFNLHPATAARILRFFLDRYEPGLFLPFEIVPDRLPDGLRELIRRFPKGALQFEVGIQSFDPEVTAHISRRQANEKVEENLRFLREQTGVHVHADLIAGLPGEGLEGFGRGFDRLVALGPQEIQVGMLKRLRGAPIARHDADIVYSEDPPYEVLRTRWIGFPEMQRLRRFARFWDLYGNSGHFVGSLPRLWEGGASPFGRFMAFSESVYREVGRTDSIALGRLAERLFAHLRDRIGIEEGVAGRAVAEDYLSVGRNDLPEGLRRFVPMPDRATVSGKSSGPPRRQERHLRRG
jgi:radical SAM superfamily enzyme YgiQ (UPF0313 family)